MQPVIACRVGRWERFAVVAQAGLRHVEVILPPPERMKELAARLADLGLSASSVSVAMDVRNDDGIAHLDEALARVRELGAALVFTSVKAEDAPRAEVYRRLRRVGDLAERHGVTVALETHPDLVTNGDVGRTTMAAVDHPRVRINYDTANVYYYNHGVDSVTELRKVLPYVAAVHLKDTTGGYRTAEFPALGRGVVDFPAVFRLLAERGYQGPFTLETEGLRGPDPEAAFAQVLQDSLDYLSDIGIFRRP